MSMKAKKKATPQAKIVRGPKKSKPTPLTMGRLRENSQAVMRTFVSYPIDPTRQFSVLELISCFYIEIRFTDEDGVETAELYYAKGKDSITATLISRTREGEAHNEMRSYVRDYRFPLYCQVKIR